MNLCMDFHHTLASYIETFSGFPSCGVTCCNITPPKGLCRGETHDPAHCTFINLLNVPNEGPLIFWVPASNHFMY